MNKIYGAPNTRTNRVLWALEEAKADYDYIHVDLMSGEARRQPFLALNPAGKVPILVNNDLVLSESAAICTYIGDLYPDIHLTPICGSIDRAVYSQWCFFALTELEQPLWNIVKHRFALPKEYRIQEMLETSIFEFNKVLDVLSLRLGASEYLVGDHFTCADLIVADILNWAVKMQHPDISLRHENIEVYFHRMIDRTAFKSIPQ